MSGIDRLPCPDCAEMVMRAARVCPLCGHEFSEIEQQLRTQGVGLLKLVDRIALVFWAIAVSAALVAFIAWIM